MSLKRVTQRIADAGLHYAVVETGAGIEVQVLAVDGQAVCSLLPIDEARHERFADYLIKDAREWIATGEMPEAVRFGDMLKDAQYWEA